MTSSDGLQLYDVAWLFVTCSSSFVIRYLVEFVTGLPQRFLAPWRHAAESRQEAGVNPPIFVHSYFPRMIETVDSIGYPKTNPVIMSSSSSLGLS